MNNFTASNGVAVREVTPVTDRGPWLLVDGEQVSPNNAQALREFFQAEADERLGRWRWPKDPRFLVYRVGEDRVTVMYEPGGGSTYWSRSEAGSAAGSDVRDAAAAYFAAHPAKPWHEAQPGEGWIIDIGDEAYPNVQAVVVSNEGKFLFRDGHSLPLDRDYIRSGRRFHPEVSA